MIDAAVERLLRVRSENRPLDKFPDGAEPPKLDDAYAVQDAFVARLDRQRYGWKIGCTSKLAQEMSNTNEPFYGRMFADSSFDSPATVESTGLFHPIVEPEIAFKIGRELTSDGAPYTQVKLLDAVAAMYPAIEVVDSRYDGGWPIGIIPTVADNGVHACFVLGAEVPDWQDVERPAISLSASVNGEFVADGVGSNALNDPINALVWLANSATRRGHTLQAGDIVTTGNICNAPIFAKPGDTAVADFGALGKVEISFSQ